MRRSVPSGVSSVASPVGVGSAAVVAFVVFFDHHAVALDAVLAFGTAKRRRSAFAAFARSAAGRSGNGRWFGALLLASVALAERGWSRFGDAATFPCVID